MSRAAPDLPAWPALLTTDLACAFTSLGEASFRLLMGRFKIAPVDCAGLAVVRWRRADIEALIDSLPARGVEMPAGDAPANAMPEDPGEAALRKAERRARG